MINAPLANTLAHQESLQVCGLKANLHMSGKKNLTCSNWAALMMLFTCEGQVNSFLTAPFVHLDFLLQHLRL